MDTSIWKKLHEEAWRAYVAGNITAADYVIKVMSLGIEPPMMALARQ